MPRTRSPPAGTRTSGTAYRASARTRPIFDTLGHNPYPSTSAEAPDARHTSSIDEGDLDRLLAVLHKAFDGTGQPVPGEGRVTVWYLEDGFQTVPPAGDGLYSGVETDKHAVSEAEQAAQLTAAVRLAYCQPAVGAFFNFELRDESSLSGWQSGSSGRTGARSPRSSPTSQAIAAARSGAITCASQ